MNLDKPLQPNRTKRIILLILSGLFIVSLTHGTFYLLGYGNGLSDGWEGSSLAYHNNLEADLLKALDNKQLVQYGSLVFVPRQDGRFSFLECRRNEQL